MSVESEADDGSVRTLVSTGLEAVSRTWTVKASASLLRIYCFEPNGKRKTKCNNR